MLRIHKKKLKKRGEKFQNRNIHGSPTRQFTTENHQNYFRIITSFPIDSRLGTHFPQSSSNKLVTYNNFELRAAQNHAVSFVNNFEKTEGRMT